MLRVYVRVIYPHDGTDINMLLRGHKMRAPARVGSGTLAYYRVHPVVDLDAGECIQKNDSL